MEVKYDEADTWPMKRCTLHDGQKLRSGIVSRREIIRTSRSAPCEDGLHQARS